MGRCGSASLDKAANFPSNATCFSVEFQNVSKKFKGLGFGAAGERRELVLPPRGWPGGVAGGLGPPGVVPVQARWRQRIFPVQDPHRTQRHLVP